MKTRFSRLSSISDNLRKYSGSYIIHRYNGAVFLKSSGHVSYWFNVTPYKQIITLINIEDIKVVSFIII